MTVDFILLAALVVRTAAGARTGLVAGLIRLVGMVGGGLLGLWAGPQLAEQSAALQQNPWARSFMVVVGVLTGVVLGEAVGGIIGRAITRARGGRIGRVDQILGGVSALIATSLMVWLVAATVRPLLPAHVASDLNSSRVLRAIDMAVPDPFNAVPARLTQGVRDQWPQVFPGMQREPRIEADPPDASLTTSPAIAKVASSVVKITTDAPRCRADSAGSGWVVAPGRVVTNAHVVAGSSTVAVQITGRGPAFPATVVGFDPDLDLAILAVEGLPSAPLPRASATSGQPVVAAGFPGGGAYTLTASRIRGTLTISGDDIHGRAGIDRQAHSVRGTVRPGNSGGPVLNAQGAVVGTVFGGSTIDQETYYALSNAATETWLAKAPALTQAVSTQGCVVG